MPNPRSRSAECIAAISSHQFPEQLRASFVIVFQRLYLDRFPHERKRLPDVVRVFPKIHRVNLRGDATLHKFALPVGHPCLDSRKPFTRMATSDKFELAENFIGDYFAAVEYQVVSDVEKNRFTVALLECVTYLAEYGFFGECVGEWVQECVSA